MPGDARIYDQARRVLTRVEEAFIAAGIALPADRYVHAGEFSWDCCEVMVVELRTLTHAFAGVGPAGGAVRCALPRTLLLRVNILRCVPLPDEQGDPPSPVAQDESAQVIGLDAWTLADGLLSAVLAGTLQGADCDRVSLGDVEFVEPLGGCGGVRQEVEVQLGEGPF